MCVGINSTAIVWHAQIKTAFEIQGRRRVDAERLQFGAGNPHTLTKVNSYRAFRSLTLQ